MFSFSADAQTIMGRQTVDSFPIANSFQCYGLRWLPQGYNFTGSKRYPLIIFLHGAGEAANPKSIAQLSKLYTNQVKTPPGQIANGWDATAVNPLTGNRDSFIVVSPQNYSGWSFGYSELKFILPDIVSRFRVDTSRVYLTGLSAGGGGTFTMLGSFDTTFMKKFTAAATASAAGVWGVNGYTDVQVEANLRQVKTAGVNVWTVAGEQDYLLNTDVRYHDSTNKLNPSPPNKLTVVQTIGHSAWNKMYDTLFRPTVNYYGSTGACNNGCNNGGISVAPNTNGSSVRGSGITQDSLNVYEWFLTKKRIFPGTPVPIAAAGLDINISLPQTNITLDGTGSTGGEGVTITSYVWQKQIGPGCTIVSPNSAVTTVNNLVAGTYVFKLTVTNSNGVSHDDNIRVVVSSTDPYSSPMVAITSGATQNIATTSATVSASFTGYGAGLKSVRWSKLKVPGQTTKKVVWIGSSTPTGTGSSVQDSAMYKRVLDFANANGLISSSINLALGGTSIWGAMPNSYTPGPGEDAVDPTRNVTAALSNNPDIVVVFYPSNDYDGFSVDQALFCYKTITQEILNAGKKPLILTTLPRQAFGTQGRLNLRALNDSLLLNSVTGPYTYNTHTPVTGYDGVTALYDYGDQIHQNDRGHGVLGSLTIAANMWAGQSSTSVIVSPNSLTTNITGLENGTHLFMVSAEDDHGQVVYATTTIVVSGAANTPPTANAGNDQTITLPNSTVLLNGSASSDPDGTIASYAWTQLNGPLFDNSTPNGVTTNISGMTTPGVYTFRLTVTDNLGSTGTDDVVITVNAAPTGCTGTSYTPVPGGDGGYYNTYNLQPGDTLWLDGAYTFSYVYLNGKSGTPSCPIVIMNKNGQAKLRGNQMELKDCKYIKILGQGSADLYGISIRPYGVDSVVNGYFGLSISGRSKNIEVANVDISNAGMGMAIKQDPDCDTMYNAPNWVMDSIEVHHNRIQHCWNQGMYIGNTAPDNGPASYSPRPIVCGGVTVYPKPMRLGHISVHDNEVSYTGRGGIQISSASFGWNLIYRNTVKYSGMNGDEAQGEGIVIGGYTSAYIYENVVTNTYTHGIGSEGGSNTDTTIQVWNNIVDSSGMLAAYDLSVTARYQININTEPRYANALTWPYNVFYKTSPNDEGDSTRFSIRDNTLKLRKNTFAIGLFDQTNRFQKTGNEICGNTLTVGTSVVNVEGSNPVYYDTQCGASAPPKRRRIRIKQ